MKSAPSSSPLPAESLPAQRALSLERFKALISGFASKRVLVIGDLMLDRFIWGNVSRISPEAPVPVVEVTSESAFPGGAANVARNLAELGAQTEAAGVIGDDEAGRNLEHLLKEAAIGASFLLRSPTDRTIVKTRVVARHQQIVRVDRDWRTEADLLKAVGLADALTHNFDAVIIEDYAKGAVRQETADEVGRLTAGRCVLAIDPNPKNPLHWTHADVVKPNRREAIEAAGTRDDDWEAAGRLLLSRWGTRSVLVTLGEDGMALFESPEAPYYHSPTRAREVFDVSGAGDTAIAVFALARACGATGPEAAELANLASGVVVGKLGTATVSTDELLAACDSQD